VQEEAADSAGNLTVVPAGTPVDAPAGDAEAGDPSAEDILHLVIDELERLGGVPAAECIDALAQQIRRSYPVFYGRIEGLLAQARPRLDLSA